jgi:hypothetical protein
MKKQPFLLDREFIKWFFEETYPEAGSNRAQVFSLGNPANKENRDYWMRQAFMAGARSVSQETLDVLADWACAVEGCDPEMLEPSEVYDRARENLFVYNTQLLNKA